MHLKQSWGSEELELNAGLDVLSRGEAVLQGGGQGDEGHCAVKGILIDVNLQQKQPSRVCMNDEGLKGVLLLSLQKETLEKSLCRQDIWTH